MNEELSNSGGETHDFDRKTISLNERLKQEREEQRIQYTRVILERQLAEDLKEDGVEREAIQKNNRGVALCKRKFFEEGVPLIKEALKLAPQDEDIAYNLPTVLFNWAFFLIDKGLYDEAILKCKESIVMNELNNEPHFALSVCFRHKGLYEQALEESRKVLALTPGDVVYRYFLGLSYLDLEKYDEAIKEFEKCVKESTKDDPNRCTYYYNLGEAYNRKGTNGKAAEAFEKVVELEPDDDYVYRLARSYYKLQLGKEPYLGEFLKYINSLDEKKKTGLFELVMAVSFSNRELDDKLLSKSKVLEGFFSQPIFEKLWQDSLQMAKNYKESLNG